MIPAEWEFVELQNLTPKQKGSVDCGVFTVLYADFLSSNLPLLFNQTDIPNFRQMIATNVFEGRMRY